jgi:hypothetical protein
MWSFRAYLQAKCADPEFLDQYRDQCNICPKTVLIISTIRERGLTNEDVARRSGVKPEHLDLLESAEQCNFDDVQKLGRCLNLSLPGECKKANGRGRVPETS